MDSPLEGLDYQDLLLRKLAQLSRQGSQSQDPEDEMPTTLDGILPELRARAQRRGSRFKERLDTDYPLSF